MKMQRTVNCGELRVDHVGREVILNGWVASRRDHGGILFVDIRDRHGVTQVTFDPEKVPAADELRGEWVVAVRGEVVERAPEHKNPNRPTGDVDLRAMELEVLNKSKTPPFEVADEVEAHDETRLHHRYVDMRRRPVRDAMIMRSEVSRIIREVFFNEGFIDVETPLLMKTTPEGARDYIVPSRLQRGSVYALPQSPQLLKQTLMACGIDRYYQICKCLRDEDLRADRQPEFTQLDMEMSFVERDDVFAVVEKTIVRLYRDLKGIELETPFPCITYQESMDRFGIDKPDTRFGLELCDVSEIVASSGFKVFSGAVAKGGSVRCIRVPGGAEMPRKKIDALEAVAKRHGAGGLAWFKIKDDGLQGPVAKFIGDEEREAIIAKAGAEVGDLMVFVADKNSVVWNALGQVRLTLGRELGLIDHDKVDCLWVVDFPLFEQDEESGAWHAMHHMFTSPKQPLPEPGANLDGILGNQYDFVMNGNEMGSGSVRIHDRAVQERVFELVGMPKEESEAKFGWFLRALEYGAPPHGGIALGLDRLVMVMVGATNLREVIAFPKTQSGVDPMTESPSAPIGDTMEVLGLEWVKEDESDA